MKLGNVAGVDGCPGGWVAVLVTPAEGWRTARIERIDRIERLLQPDVAPAAVAIDIPIGLPAHSGPRGRTPDRMVRPLLGERQSSVFSIPSRSAVYAGVNPAVPELQRFKHACEIARATSAEQRAIAIQSFRIFPKICELDLLLRAQPELIGHVHECHPEVSFWAMNERRPLGEPKKVKGRPYPPGLALRRRLLAAQGLPERLTDPAVASSLHVGPDDLVDACAAAWTAGRIARGEALSFPHPPERDPCGLPVAIHA